MLVIFVDKGRDYTCDLHAKINEKGNSLVFTQSGTTSNTYAVCERDKNKRKRYKQESPFPASKHKSSRPRQDNKIKTS